MPVAVLSAKLGRGTRAGERHICPTVDQLRRLMGALDTPMFNFKIVR